MTGKIYCEDNLETMDLMADGSIDLVVTSPPYDNLRKYNGYSFNFEAVARELFRVKIGFRLHDTMIYAKKNYVPLTHNRYEQCWEYMFVLSKKSPTVFNPIKIPCIQAGKVEKYGLERRQNHGPEHSMRLYSETQFKAIKETKIAPNIFTYTLGSDKTGHPAPFPEQLAEDHILSWSGPGDIVYDPFMGSGTVAKMAIKNNRQFIGSEISEEYCKIAEERIMLL